MTNRDILFGFTEYDDGSIELRAEMLAGDDLRFR